MTSRYHLLQNPPVDLCKIPLSEWEELFRHLDLGPEIQKKVYTAVFRDFIFDLADLPGISEDERNKLTRAAIVRRSERHDVIRSRDGSYKLTLRLHDGHLTETVIIPEWKNGILRKCSASISSQIGCFFGCSFCSTGQMGFHRNLSTGELLDQVREAEAVALEELNSKLTHLYFMGMGEPMHNYRSVSDALAIMKNNPAPGLAASRITISTVGLFRQIRMLARDHPGIQLAVSIHSADQQKRYKIMPVSARLGLSEIRDALVFYHRQTGNRITIQYLMMKGINDSMDDAKKLITYLGDLPAEVTLIMYNNVPESEMSRSEKEKAFFFQTALKESGRSTSIRWCYGEDIDAGCGQLKVRTPKERTTMSIQHRTDSSKKA